MTTTDTPAGLAQLVDRRVRDLQDGYLAVPSKPRAVADLAELRRAASAAPGAVPAVWDLTSVPWVDAADPRLGEEPTPEEAACHTALTLFAFHQQSRSRRMHETSVGGRASNSLGTAVGRLVEATRKSPREAPAADRISSTRRRFNALVTASTRAELVHHLRGLIHQLNQREISLDYGRLADDLVYLDDPRRADRVRLRWARDLAWSTRRRADEAPGPTPDSSGPSPAPDGSPGPAPQSGEAASVTTDHDLEETW
jgi:CRISPR system Cascade subunit CasB